MKQSLLAKESAGDLKFLECGWKLSGIQATGRNNKVTVP